MSLTFFKQKLIFQEAANERMGEMRNLRKEINFNDLTYYFKSNSNQKSFISFKAPLGFYINIKHRYTTLEKTEKSHRKKKKKKKEDINEIEKGKWEFKSEKQKIALKILKIN